MLRIDEKQLARLCEGLSVTVEGIEFATFLQSNLKNDSSAELAEICGTISAALYYCSGFPSPQFSRLHELGILNRNWPKVYAEYYFRSSGAQISSVEEFLSGLDKSTRHD